MGDDSQSDNPRQEVTQGAKNVTRRIGQRSKATEKRLAMQAMGQQIPEPKNPRKVAAGSLGGRTRATNAGEQVQQPVRQRESREVRAMRARDAVVRSHKRDIDTRRNYLTNLAQHSMQANAILAEGAIESALYMVRIVRGEYLDVPHSVRVDAAKAVIDRSISLNDALHKNQVSDDNPMNQWTIERLDSFIIEGERQIGTDKQSELSQVISTPSDESQPSEGIVSTHSPGNEGELASEAGTPPHPPAAAPDPVPADALTKIP